MNAPLDRSLVKRCSLESRNEKSEVALPSWRIVDLWSEAFERNDSAEKTLAAGAWNWRSLFLNIRLWVVKAKDLSTNLIFWKPDGFVSTLHMPLKAPRLEIEFWTFVHLWFCDGDVLTMQPQRNTGTRRSTLNGAQSVKNEESASAVRILWTTFLQCIYWCTQSHQSSFYLLFAYFEHFFSIRSLSERWVHSRCAIWSSFGRWAEGNNLWHLL